MSERRRGYLITFEGPEGAGKTTAVGNFVNFLRENCETEIIQKREPGGTVIGDQFRKIVHDAKNQGIVTTAEIFGYLGARAQLVGEVIAPALDAGKIIVCDRFIDSTLAYQGFGRGIDLQFLSHLNHVATIGIVPDLTFLMDIDVVEGLKRCQVPGREWNRMDAQSIDFHQRVRQGYLMLANGSPGRFEIVDASKDKQEVLEEITNIASKKLTAVGLLGLK